MRIAKVHATGGPRTATHLLNLALIGAVREDHARNRESLPVCFGLKPTYSEIHLFDTLMPQQNHIQEPS